MISFLLWHPLAYHSKKADIACLREEINSLFQELENGSITQPKMWPLHTGDKVTALGFVWPEEPQWQANTSRYPYPGGWE